MIINLRLLLSLFLIGFCESFALAQTVTGTVTESNGSPLPGVSVVVKNTTLGSTTDANGNYSVSVPGADAVLLFSFIGYSTLEVPVNGRSIINASLQEDIQQLSEVVVTALGIPRETKTLVYATQSVKAAQLTEVRDPNNVINSFQGKIANAVISQGSGGPGSGARIVLRGNRSIQGNNNALMVVDGVPISNNTYQVPGNDFGTIQGSDGASNINPDDIESVTVLRGASAAALYGSQAGNGVIVITTKRAKPGELLVNINSGITAEKAFALPKVQNGYGQGNGGILNGTSGESWGARLEGQSYTNHLGEQRTYVAQADNIKDFFRTGVSLNNSVGVAVGAEKVQGYLSYTNNNIKGIVPNNDLERHTINLRLTNQLSRKLSTDAKITYIIQDIKNRPRTGEENAPVIDIYQIPRNVSTSDARNSEFTNNVGVPTPTPWPSTLSSIYQNPYWLIDRMAINEKRDRLMGFVMARYAITDWLNVQGRVNIDRTVDQGEEIYSFGTLLWANQPGGRYATSSITHRQQWFDAMLDGENKLGKNMKINYRIGTIFQDGKNEQLYNNANGLNVTNKPSLNFATNPAITTYSVRTQVQSIFAQTNLAIKEAIFIDASFRNDWDSRLPSPHTYQYASLGASAVVSDLIELPAAVSFLKASANYAEVGNGGAAQIRFNTYNYIQGAGAGFIGRGTTQALADLKPEIVKNLEFGIDTKLFDDRFGVTLTYYKSNSFNQLLTLPLPSGSGYSNKYINAGNIQNSGIEVVLYITPVKTNVVWEANFNLGINRSKVVELDPNIKRTPIGGLFARSADPIVEEGGRFGDLIAFRWQRDVNGNLRVNSNGLPVMSAQQEYIGNYNPKAVLGLTNTLTYKKFSLRLLVDGRAGGVAVSGTEMNLAFSGIPEITSHYREGGWNLGGVDENGAAVEQTITAQQFWQTASGKRYGNGEFFAYDATNFRVRELSLGYDLPIPKGIFIKSARISLIARNVLWLYRGKSLLDIPGLGKRRMWFDPDMSLGNGNFQGTEYGALPSTRSIGFNLRLSF